MTKALRTSVLVAALVAWPGVSSAHSMWDLVYWFDGLSGPQFRGGVLSLPICFYAAGEDPAEPDWRIWGGCPDRILDSGTQKKLKFGFAPRFEYLKSFRNGYPFPAGTPEEDKAATMWGIGLEGFVKAGPRTYIRGAVAGNRFSSPLGRDVWIWSVEPGVDVTLYRFPNRVQLVAGFTWKQFVADIDPLDFGATPGLPARREGIPLLRLGVTY